MLAAAGLLRAVCDAELELELEPHAARHRTQNRATATGSLALIGIMRCLPMVVTKMLVVSLCLAGKPVRRDRAPDSSQDQPPCQLSLDRIVSFAHKTARRRRTNRSLPVRS